MISRVNKQEGMNWVYQNGTNQEAAYIQHGQHDLPGWWKPLPPIQIEPENARNAKTEPASKQRTL